MSIIKAYVNNTGAPDYYYNGLGVRLLNRFSKFPTAFEKVVSNEYYYNNEYFEKYSTYD